MKTCLSRSYGEFALSQITSYRNIHLNLLGACKLKYDDDENDDNI